MIRRIQGQETRRGVRVRSSVPITAPRATELLLQRNDLHKLQTIGFRLALRRPIPLSGREDKGKLAIHGTQVSGFIWRVTEDQLWPLFGSFGLTETERRALRPVIRGLVLVQDEPVDVCRTCQVRWLIRRGRTLDCKRCWNALPPWTRSRRAHMAARRSYSSDIEDLRRWALEAVMARIPRDTAGRLKQPVQLQDVEDAFRALGRQLYERVTVEIVKNRKPPDGPGVYSRDHSDVKREVTT